MRTVISLQGGMAAGKTTLARKLEARLSDYYFSYENSVPQVKLRKAKKLDIRKKEDFIANQRIFIQAEIDRYKRLPAGKVIMDRGPEDTECYTLNFPASIGADWDMEAEMPDELARLRQCRSDKVVFLEVQADILKKRKERDTGRTRSSFESYIYKLHELEKDWFKRLPHCTVLPADKLAPDEILEKTLALLP